MERQLRSNDMRKPRTFFFRPEAETSLPVVSTTGKGPIKHTKPRMGRHKYASVGVSASGLAARSTSRIRGFTARQSMCRPPGLKNIAP